MKGDSTESSTNPFFDDDDDDAEGDGAVGVHRHAEDHRGQQGWKTERPTSASKAKEVAFTLPEWLTELPEELEVSGLFRPFYWTYPLSNCVLFLGLHCSTRVCPSC